MDAGRGHLSRRGLLAGGLMGIGALLVSACGADEGTPDDGPVPAGGSVTVAPDGTQEITLVVRDDYAFYPAEFSVAPGRVRLTLSSQAEQLTHNIRFTPGEGPERIEEEIPILVPGEQDTIEFEVQAAGDHRYECSFHTALGQVGTMTVTGA